MSRLGLRLLSSSLLSAAALAGCSESSAPSARFADATPAQLERAFEAATGRALLDALAIGVDFWGRNDPRSCPSVETRGSDTTITGGCTTENDERLEGSIVIHNLAERLDDPAYDP